MAIGNGKLKVLLAGAFAMALCFALVGCGGSSASSSAASASDSAASAAESASAAETASSAAEAASAAEVASSTAASKASVASAASAASKFPAEAVDAHGNITLYAIMELTGPELTELLEAQEYEWDAKNSTWMRMVDGAMFFAVKETGQLGQADYAAATEKGGAAVAISCNIVGGYKDAAAALKGNAKCVIEDSFADGDAAIAIVYGPSMAEYLVIAQPYTESTIEIDMYSKGAVGSGMLDEVYGKQIGGSFEEAWKTFTGKESYGH